MSPTSNSYLPSLGDRVAIILFMLAGAAIICWSGIAMVLQLVTVLSGAPLRVPATLFDVAASAPLGPGGSAVDVQLETVILTATDLSIAGTAAAAIEPVLTFLTTTIVVTCLLWLARNTLRGRIFGRGNTVLITVAGMTALVGFAVVPIFGRMVANDTLARISEGDFGGFAATVSPFPFILGAFIFAIVATAYTVGARLQRDAEGLV